MVGRLPVMSPSDAAKLNAEINASSSTPAHKPRIADAVLIEPSTASTIGVPVAEPSGKQSFMFPEHYIVQSDVGYGVDLSKTADQIALRFGSRFKQAGLVRVPEQSFGRMASLLAALRQ
jgi:hypothetical protein